MFALLRVSDEVVYGVLRGVCSHVDGGNPSDREHLPLHLVDAASRSQGTGFHLLGPRFRFKHLPTIRAACFPFVAGQPYVILPGILLPRRANSLLALDQAGGLRPSRTRLGLLLFERALFYPVACGSVGSFTEISPRRTKLSAVRFCALQ